jgi:hypothetical protein
VIGRFVYALVLLAMMGVNQPHALAATGTAKSPVKTPADARIEETIKAKLAKSKLRSDHFTFSVSKGVATIEGNTSVMQHKGVMTRIAKTSGAVSVRNNIRISDAAKAKANASLAKTRPAPASPAAPETPAPSIPRAVVLRPGSQ